MRKIDKNLCRESRSIDTSLGFDGKSGRQVGNVTRERPTRRFGRSLTSGRWVFRGGAKFKSVVIRVEYVQYDGQTIFVLGLISRCC